MADVLQKRCQAVGGDPQVVMILQAEHDAVFRGNGGGFPQGSDDPFPIRRELLAAGRIAAEDPHDFRPEPVRQLRELTLRRPIGSPAAEPPGTLGRP